MKAKGFGHTSRGVLGSVLLLAAGAWVFERIDLPEGPPPGPRVASVERPPSPPDVVPSSVSVPRGGDAIRVAVTRRAVRSVRLRIDGPFRIVPLTGGMPKKTFVKPLVERTITASFEGLTVSGATFPKGGEIVPDRSPSVWVDGRQYRGSVRLHVTDDGRLRPVNVLPLEEYLAAVVDSEMPAAFPAAARQAQAVVARTYAISCRRAPPHPWFDLYSTPVSQNYLGFVYHDGDGRLLAGETPAGRAAVDATRGLVCTHRGRLFRTYYSACCGGRTVSGRAAFDDATPTLSSVPCGGCETAPLYRWERRTDSAFDDLGRLARTRLPHFGSLRSAETTGGDVAVPRTVVLTDGRRRVTVSAAEVKSALGLPSLLFELSDGEGRISGRGHGHGVGLCQWGAKGLAERGLSAEGILKHYYPGCEVSRLE